MLFCPSETAAPSAGECSPSMRMTKSTSPESTPHNGVRETSHVEAWRDGAPVLLVHGSPATGMEEWDAQRPLAGECFRLLVLDRRGDGDSPPACGEASGVRARTPARSEPGDTSSGTVIGRG